jgi:hypothetical protein
MANYLNDSDLYYEIVLSKGKGFLTKKAERMFILIGENMIRTKNNKYKTSDDRDDCLQTGLLFMFEKWTGFDEKKFKLALPYFSEIFKRGMAQGYNDVINKKTNQERVVWISLDSCNDGEGFHNY